jgi:hypothetical protein
MKPRLRNITVFCATGRAHRAAMRAAATFGRDNNLPRRNSVT